MHFARHCFRILLDAFYRFNRDDGWAIASHIALSTLMSMFPFLILVTAIAGFIGSKNLADEVGRLIIAAWPQEVSGGIAQQTLHASRQVFAPQHRIQLMGCPRLQVRDDDRDAIDDRVFTQAPWIGAHQHALQHVPAGFFFSNAAERQRLRISTRRAPRAQMLEVRAEHPLEPLLRFIRR